MIGLMVAIPVGGLFWRGLRSVGTHNCSEGERKFGATNLRIFFGVARRFPHSVIEAQIPKTLREE